MRMESPLNQRLRWSPPDVVYTPIDVTSSRAKRNTKVFYMLQHLVRCAECGMLFGGRATRQNTVKRNGKVYHYDLDPPRRYYQCYGMQKRLFRCREHPFIRAERLEDLIWGEVKKAVQNPRSHSGWHRRIGRSGGYWLGRGNR